MSNKSDKAKQEELRRENERLRAESTADRAALREPSALEKEFEGQSLGWFNFLKDPNRDFSKAPMPFTGTAEEGAAGAEEERTALGAMQFGAAAADPNLQAVLKENIKERRAQRKGQALENAVGRYDAMMRGMAGDVMARDLARRQGVAGLTTGAQQNALNSWAQFTPRPHWGLSLATAGIAGAGSALSGGFAAGGAFT
jgi:hypothetical protein